MPTSEGEAIEIARETICQHGDRAVLVAVERLNAMIDRDDWRERDLWARVVHAIHELQSGGEPADPDDACGSGEEPIPKDYPEGPFSLP
jgi:hypothetical protein